MPRRGERERGGGVTAASTVTVSALHNCHIWQLFPANFAVMKHVLQLLLVHHRCSCICCVSVSFLRHRVTHSDAEN